MTSKFVKEVVKREVVEVLNGEGPDFVLMSVERYQEGFLSLVIGAKWDDRCAYRISKDGLAQLIETLKEIHEVM